ncbi:hypothetical protein [uncultured Cohaesibacter sp.]|uniref:hypothetical protein n=1 Tax=uncultured Cohaesibacter sp. TaxID=1002546 RepID=UPI002AAB2663|nr:hypothetical protein [uncultured Cohaesibacter sp.]
MLDPTSLLGYINEHQNFVIALATALSAIAALASLLLVVLTSRYQMLHNRLSVRPIAQISFGDYENELSVAISNMGMGPLIIDKVVFDKEGEGSFVDQPLVSLMPDLPAGLTWRDFSTVSAGTVISAQSEKFLVVLDLDDKDNDHVEAADQVRRELGKITISCHYSDLYKRRQPVTNRKLDWFVRRFT